MKRVNLAHMTTEQLVQTFADMAVQQDVALLSRMQRVVNKIYWKLEAVENELKSRPGDQRSALLPLYNHRNMQVRVKAAKATLAIAPEAARAQLEAIRASGWQPQALEAGMSLGFLDEGIYKPK
jgi:cytochrome c oxidase assembly protein Cox11